MQLPPASSLLGRVALVGLAVAAFLLALPPVIHVAPRLTSPLQAVTRPGLYRDGEHCRPIPGRPGRFCTLPGQGISQYPPLNDSIIYDVFGAFEPAFDSSDNRIFTVHFLVRPQTWPWPEFRCRFEFPAGQVTAGNATTCDGRVIWCPVPPASHHSAKEAGLFNISLLKKDSDVVLASSPHLTELQVPFPKDAHHYGVAIHTYVGPHDHITPEEVAEWLAYHKRLGFDHVYVWLGKLPARTLRTWEKFAAGGYVTIIPWLFPVSTPAERKETELMAMQHGLKLFGPFNRWIAYINLYERFQPNVQAQKWSNTRYAGGAPDLMVFLDYGFRHEPARYTAIQFEVRETFCNKTTKLSRGKPTDTLLERCRLRTVKEGESRRLFVRPLRVPALNSTDVLQWGEFTFVPWIEFGRMRRYHPGERPVSGLEDDDSMDRWVAAVRKDIGLSPLS